MSTKAADLLLAGQYADRLRLLAADEAGLLLDTANDRKMRIEAAAASAFCLDLADRFAKLAGDPAAADLAGRVEDALGYLERLEHRNPAGMIAVELVVENVREYLGGVE